MSPDENSRGPVDYNDYALWDTNVHVGEFVEDPGLGKTFGASWRHGTILGTWFNSETQKLSSFQHDHVDPEFERTKWPFLEEYRDRPEARKRLMKAHNFARFHAIKADIDRETLDNEIREASSWTPLTDPASSAVDLPFWIPWAKGLQAAKFGYSVLGKAGAEAFGAAIGTGVQEGVLLLSQQMRDPKESIANISGSALTSFVLGGLEAKVLSPIDLKKVKKDLDDVLASPGAREASSGGQAGAVKPDFTRVGDPSVERALEKTAAGLRNGRREAVVQAQSAAARKISLQLTSSEAAAKGELEGRALGQAAATALERHQARQADFSQGLWKLYEDVSQKDQSVIWDRFKADVTKAYRGGSAGSGGNEFVTRAARALNDMVVEPAVRQMKDLEMIARDTSPSLLSRVVDPTKVIAGLDVFRDIVGEWAGNAISTQVRKAIAPQSDDSEPVSPHSQDRDAAPGFHNAADRAAYVDEVVDGIIGNVTGRAPFEGPDWVVPVAHGPLKNRLFDIPDGLIDNFLEHDVEVIADAFTRKTAPAIELTRAFGSADMKNAFADLKADYDLRIAQAGSEEERQSLQGEYERVSERLADFRDGLRDNYRVDQTASVWKNTTRAARAWNNAGYGVDGMFRSLADVARTVAGRGVTGFMKDTLPELVSSTRAARITRQDARDFSTILETVTKARMASLTGLTNPFATKSAAETLADSLDDRFSRGSAINWWNTTMKDALSVYTMNRIAKTVMVASEEAGDGAGEVETRADFSTLSRRRRSYMDKLGIDEPMAVRIGDQTRKHGAQENGIWGLNLAKWDDAGARRVLLDAIAEEVDRVPAMDGRADMPLWARSNLGQLVMRFKSHVLEAHQRVLFSRLSGRPKHLAEFLTTGASMGMLNVYLDHIAEGDFEGVERLMDQPEDWITAGLGRGGILPVLVGSRGG